MKSVKLKENQVKYRIFEYILRAGPATLYDITKEFPKMKQANLSRVMKRLASENSITIVKSEVTPRHKTFFGPTIWGLFDACAQDDRFKKNFDGYYSKWMNNQQFRSSTEQLIKEEHLKENPKRAMEILERYLDYILDTLKIFDERKSYLPVELQVFFGEMLMQMYKPEETKKRTDEFYKYIIPFSTNVKAVVTRTAKVAREFERTHQTTLKE